MEVLFIFETKDITKIESCVISQIKEFRYKKRKDFYEIDINLLKYLINSCNQLTLKFKKNIDKLNIDKKGGALKDNINHNIFLYIAK
jgi:DNA polymerase III gamma/tau subunit